jgi:surface polysaccharide O-acyltransferase-like enzyme
MLRNRHVRSKFQLSLTIMLFLVGGAFTIMGTFWLSRARGAFDPFFYKYFSVTVVAMTVALFIFVRSVFNTRKVIGEDGKQRIRLNSPKLLQKIGMSVFGVYLVHALILELLRDGHLGFTIDHTSAFGIEFSLALGLPIFAVSIFVFSLVPVLAIRFVPIVRDMVT